MSFESNLIDLIFSALLNYFWVFYFMITFFYKIYLIFLVVVPAGCQECTKEEKHYCMSADLISDHCCCDRRFHGKATKFNVLYLKCIIVEAENFKLRKYIDYIKAQNTTKTVIFFNRS